MPRATVIVTAVVTVIVVMTARIAVALQIQTLVQGLVLAQTQNKNQSLTLRRSERREVYVEIPLMRKRKNQKTTMYIWKTVMKRMMQTTKSL